MGEGTKSKTLRELEAKSVKEFLEEEGVTPDNSPELSSFWRILEAFVNQAYGCSGNIEIPRLHRLLRYQLCVRETSESSAVLQNSSRTFDP